MAELEILDGENAGYKYEIDRQHLIIGNAADCDICLSDASLSHHHAVLEYSNDTWELRDPGSKGGTFVEDQQIQRILIPEETCFRLGQINFRFSPFESPAESADKPSSEAKELPAADELSLEAMESIRKLGDLHARIEREFGQVIIGQREVLEQLLIAIASGGHCLMIGLPGLAKTLMVQTLSSILRLKFKRIQFTPDLMPSDIIGTDVLEVNEATNQKTFRFIKGPIFTNMLLADEINRTPPKTQAALLESMQEHQVTVSNQVFALPPPFFVLATQNPLEQEGTYPLPEAQLDRFMFNILVDYPNEAEEEAIIAATTSKQSADLSEILDAEELLHLHKTVRELPVSPHIIKYATRLVRATRPQNERAPQFIRDYVFCGAGPRAAQYLVLGAKARSVLRGRFNVNCDDVRALALPVLRHRIFTNFSADSEEMTPDKLVERLLATVPEPGPEDY
jgi:MoxR-like ATPase